MELDRALKLVASGETTSGDIERDIRRLLHHGEFFAAAVLTLVLHGRESGAWENLVEARIAKRSIDHANVGRDVRFVRALSGETVDE